MAVTAIATPPVTRVARDRAEKQIDEKQSDGLKLVGRRQCGASTVGLAPVGRKMCPQLFT